MIEVRNLHKTYGPVVAVDDVSFTANRGEIYGLLGPNGAGKTSTLRMLYGLSKADGGSLSVDGLDVPSNVVAVQKRIGVLPDSGSLYTRLTARENIAYFGKLHGMSQQQIDHSIQEFVDILDMNNIIDRKTGGFSQGERMKVCLARAVVHNPDYILLDEPTNGLDVLTTRSVRAMLLRLKKEGKCVVFSSHIMHEVANLCDRVGIIANGRIVTEGDQADVIANAGVTDMEDAFVHYAYGKNANATANLTANESASGS